MTVSNLQIRDRFSFMRFQGLQIEDRDRIPYAKTVWLFRERHKGLKLADVLFVGFHQQMTIQGCVNSSLVK